MLLFNLLVVLCEIILDGDLRLELLLVEEKVFEEEDEVEVVEVRRISDHPGQHPVDAAIIHAYILKDIAE